MWKYYLNLQSVFVPRNVFVLLSIKFRCSLIKWFWRVLSFKYDHKKCSETSFKCGQQNYRVTAKLLFKKDVDYPCFQILSFSWCISLVADFLLTPQPHAKYLKRGNVVPYHFIVLVLHMTYETRTMLSKISVELTITKSNGTYVPKSLIISSKIRVNAQ